MADYFTENIDMDAEKKPSKKTTMKEEKDNNERKRGRPAGRNRVPLNKVERRARNAHYERERRQETASAYKDLALAIGISATVPNGDLLSKVVGFIKKSSKEKKEQLKMVEENDRLDRDIKHLEKVNKDLEMKNESDSERNSRTSKSASSSSN